MRLLSSERTTAVVLVIAAVLGLILANSPARDTLFHLRDAHLGVGPVTLSVGHWISDGLLAVFFFTVAIELKHELTRGELRSVSKALQPAIAAVCGVIVPAGLYFAITLGSDQTRGWPIPTATDIAFALGVLAVFGRGLPRRIRIFLLALAVLDDLIAIIIIALFFTANPNLIELGTALITVTLFGVLSRKLRSTKTQWPIALALVALAVITWWLVEDSGVHATIAGVALGLVMSREPAARVRHVLEPWSNGVILPLFAFFAALVVIPSVAPHSLSPAFWGILVGLPIGKCVGIGIGALLGALTRPREERQGESLLGILTIATLGGIGFTVSLLMNELAFANSPLIRSEGTLAVLLGSGISTIAASILVSITARRYRAAHQ